MGDKGYLHPFWDARLFDSGVGDEIRTLVELKMDRLSYYIRSIPSWWSFLEDSTVLKQWRDFASTQVYLPDNPWEEDSTPLQQAPSLTEYQTTWVLDELRYYARRRSNCQVSCFERIWESDIAMTQDTRRAMCTQIDKSYESLRQECLRRTWPGSSHPNTTILDFIHPHDFPIISGRTFRFEDDVGERRIVRALLGAKYSALPTDFHIPSEGPVIRLGYISGVSPSMTLLDHITTAVENFIPLFERTLTSLHRANHALMKPRIAVRKPPIEYERGPDPPDEPGQGIGEGTDDEGDEEMWHAWDRATHNWAQTRVPILPDLPSGGYTDRLKGSGLEEGENRVSLRGRNVQVFVKLSRVELTPDNPSFSGGDWTCEGSYENRIVACGSIVLDSNNVTEGKIGFRMAVTRPFLTASDPDFACMKYWGKRRYSSLNQHIGSVMMKEGRCITYPNLYQHRLSPFSLVDSSKAGHRTTLQLQLVDPEITVLSTSDVPPQPVSWALDALYKSLDERLPTEVVLKIIDFALEEEYFLPDDHRWPLRCDMHAQNALDREKLGFYFDEWL